MIISPEEIVSVSECQRKSESCYKFNIAPIMEEIKEIKQKLESMGLEVAKLPKTLTDALDARYADKKTEKNVDKLVWLVLTAVVIAVLSLVLKSS